MPRYIDADLIPWFIEGTGDIPVITKEEVDNMSEAIVRCKNCEYYVRNLYSKYGKYGLCSRHCDIAIYTWEDGYCHFAERKEE